MHKGFIKLHRKLTEWEWYDDPNTFRLFIHLLLKANYKDKKWHGITVKRGSFITGYDKLTSELNLSKQQIRTSITKLKSTGEITYQSTHQYSVATIVNYDVHQDREKVATHQVTPKATPYQHTSNTRATPTKNVKKDKNVKNKDIYVFDFKKEVLLLGVDKETLNDWLKVRKNKKATNSQTAYNSILKEIKKSGLHPQQAIEMAAANSWSGFKSSWIKTDTTSNFSKAEQKTYNTLANLELN